MNNLLTFANKEFGQLRTIETDKGTYFIGRDICTMFGDKNPSRSLARIDDEDKKIITITDNLGREQTAIAVNESGMYGLLFAMQPQKANNDGLSDAYPIAVQQRIDKLRAFKHWVTSEVLPAIHRQGCYYNPSEKTCDAVIMTITPEMAAEMLENNIGNRKLNMAAVKRLAEDMRMGKFALNGTSLKFYKDGTLADGQHRCAACVKAGVPFTTYVIKGLDKNVLPTIDCGRPRSLVDSLNMTGCTIQKKLVPAMNTYFSKGIKLTANQAQILWNTYEDKFNMLCEVLAGGHHDHILSQSSVRAYLIHLAVSENWNEEDIKTFTTGLRDKPNRETAYELSCYNFRNFYDRRVRNKISDQKKQGDRTKTAVVIDALSSLTESYKSGRVVKSFAWKGRAKNILDAGYNLAQNRFALIEAENQKRIGMEE